MARLTRKFLTALGIEDENVQDQIITAHTETTDALKEQRDSFKADAEKLPDVQRELNELKSQAGDTQFKDKYDKLKKEYDDYKLEQKEKETTAKKRSAYKKLLKDAGVSESRIDTVLKVSDFGSLEFDDKGEVKDSDKIKDHIKSEWKDFIVKTEEKGANVDNPPENTGRSKAVGRAKQLQAQYYEEKYQTKTEEAK